MLGTTNIYCYGFDRIHWKVLRYAIFNENVSTKVFNSLYHIMLYIVISKFRFFSNTWINVQITIFYVYATSVVF